MRGYISIVIFLFSVFSFQAQNKYEGIDLKMDAMPDDFENEIAKIVGYINQNFSTSNDKLRAAFYWTASTITYDVENMFNQKPNQTAEQKISNCLQTKKGVCMHYAEVFSAITNKLGIKTIMIPGYTKDIKGKVVDLSHLWCASYINENWVLSDPTWASGYLFNNKYIKKLNNLYYQTEPSKMIINHMPFDYIFQFLDYPINNKEFYDGKVDVTKEKKKIDFISEINNYEKLSESEKAFESSKRIEENGVVNTKISEYLKNTKSNFTTLNQNKNIEKLNLIGTNFNAAVFLLNDFINYRNKKFKPEISDEELLQMITNVKDKLNTCKDDVYNIGSVGSQNTANLYSLKKNILEAVDKTKEYETFVKNYLSKGTLERKMMFVKRR